MTGVLTLSDGDVVILRDQASQFYMQAGQDADPTSAVARLISGNVGVLQPTCYFKVHTTPMPGFWTITTLTTRKFLKVDVSATGNQNKLTWVDTDPHADFVLDKTPYYFSFTKVDGFDSPVLYVLGTYYNGGMTLQQPGGAGTDLAFGLPKAIPGAPPEVSFEVTVSDDGPNSAKLMTKDFVALDHASSSVATGGVSSSSVSSSSHGGGSNKLSGWAVAFIVLIAVLALLALGYGAYMISQYYSGRQKMAKRRQQPPPSEEEQPPAEEQKAAEGAAEKPPEFEAEEKAAKAAEEAKATEAKAAESTKAAEASAAAATAATKSAGARAHYPFAIPTSQLSHFARRAGMTPYNNNSSSPPDSFSGYGSFGFY